jgi:TRAP-type C4-dicarboxylate transport system substrate-binding protein
MIRQIVKVVAHAAIVCIGAVGIVPAVSAQNWDLYTYMPSQNASVKRVQVMLDDIKKETGGKLNIRLHLGGSLQISTTNITQAVGDNVVQMGDDSFFTGNIPVSGVMRLPLLIRTYEEFDKAAKVVDPVMAAAYAKRGIIMLGRYHYPPQVLWSSKKLTSLADLKGQKLRVTSPEQAEFLKRFGATSVTIGTPEVAPALERGVIDGVVTASSGGGVIWKDLLKYNYRLGVNYVDNVIIVNADAFGKLPADMQAKVRKIVADAMPQVTQALLDDEDAFTKKFQADGIVVTLPNPNDVKEVGTQFAPFWDSWAKTRGPETVETLSKVRAVLGR